ncbi:External alternative NAD(P)H-ubiquinone oxidoreductase [Venturia inaequalis]|nr:External alternative NAD(P)H-ubiquinone oxidoreductase [Venturia inaequalis]
MQLATLLSSSLAAFSLAPTTTLACHTDSDPKKTQDCCWGGKSDDKNFFYYGYAGCFNQHAYDVCNYASYVYDWCTYHNVTEKDCNADCCTVSSKTGRACP